MTALLLFAISLVSGVIYERTRSLSVIYGSLTVALVFLYSVYLAASALLLGAEVAAAWSRPSDGHGRDVARQIRRVALGLFVHQDPPATPGPTRPRVPDRSALSGTSSLGELGERLPHLREMRLQLGRAREVRLSLQVTAQLALSKAKEHLGAGALA